MRGLAVGAASFAGPLYISEHVPPRLRGGKVSFNQLMITLGILLVAHIGRPGTFWLYAGFRVLAVAFFAARVPDTSGRSLEDIERDLGAPSGERSKSASRAAASA